MTDVLAQLNDVLKQRKEAGDPATSYVAQLHHKGLNKIIEKVGEECTETIIAAKDCERSGNTSLLVSESADLLFHTMIMLSHLGADISEVTDELARRFDLSGLEEKAARQTQ